MAGLLALVAADDRGLVGDRALDHLARARRRASAAARGPRGAGVDERPQLGAVEQRVLPQLAEPGASFARRAASPAWRGRTRPAAAGGTRRRGSCRRADRPRSCRRSRRRSSRRASSGAGSRRMPRYSVAATNPARSPTTPPPSATIAEPRSRPRAISSSQSRSIRRERLARPRPARSTTSAPAVAASSVRAYCATLVSVITATVPVAVRAARARDRSRRRRTITG